MNTTHQIQLAVDFQQQYPCDKYHVYILNELSGNEAALQSLSSILRASLMCGDSKINPEIGAIAIPKQIFGRMLYQNNSSDAFPNRFAQYCSVDSIYAERVSSIVNGFVAGFRAKGGG